MPKGTRKTSIVTKRKMLGGKRAYYTSGPSSKGKWAEDEGDVRVKVGDKGLAKIKSAPTGSTVTSRGNLHLTPAAKKRKAMANKAKATVDKAGKDAIELVRRKKSTYRDDYKD